MSKLKYFSIILCVLAISLSSCINGADKYQSGDGTKGSAKYYLEDANNKVASGDFVYSVVGYLTDAYGRIMKEAPVATGSIKKTLLIESSEWRYYYWTPDHVVKMVTALYDGVSDAEEQPDIPAEPPVPIINWEIDSPRAYKAVTDALEAAPELESINGNKKVAVSVDLSTVYGMCYMLPSKNSMIRSQSIISSLGKKLSSRISGSSWWDTVPDDHPIWFIALVVEGYEPPFYGIVDGKTGELLESGWEEPI